MENANDNAKKVDGVKRLSSTDLQKSRKIVLDTIGEYSALDKKSKPTEKIEANFGKKLDAVIPNLKRAELNIGLNASKTIEDIKKKFSDKKSEILKELVSETKFKENKRLAVPKEIQTKKEIIKTKPADFKNYAPDFKNIRTLSSKVSENIGKNLNRVPPPLKTNFVVSKKTKIFERTGKFDLVKLVNIFPRIGLGLSRSLSSSGQILKSSLKGLFDFILTAFLIFITAYILLITLVIEFNIDNHITRTINVFLPIPALISKDVVINYYLYKDYEADLASSSSGNVRDQAKTMNKIITDIVLEKLLGKYKITANDYSDSGDLRDAISSQMAYDVVVNQVAINRINKIKQMINTSEDFFRVSEKYGDEQGEKNISELDLNDMDYKSSLANLKIGEITDVITQPEGYYIFYYRSKNENIMNLRFIFVKAVNLDDYLNEEVKNFKYISLVD